MSKFEGKEIRALCLNQPYAELMLYGKIETRTWSTNYRGLVLICSNKKPYHQEEFYEISGKEQYDRICELIDIGNQYNGYAIAIGELVDCRLMTIEDEDKCFAEYMTPWIEKRKRKNKTFKYVEKKLWCHIYKNVREIKPFPWKGFQGFHNISEFILKNIQFK